MEALVCKNCGSNAVLRKNGFLFCPYCESRFTITEEERRSGFGAGGRHAVLSHSNVNASIDLDEDVARLLEKCRANPRNARKYANLILDIDPDNAEARRYL